MLPGSSPDPRMPDWAPRDPRQSSGGLVEKTCRPGPTGKSSPSRGHRIVAFASHSAGPQGGFIDRAAPVGRPAVEKRYCLRKTANLAFQNIVVPETHRTIERSFAHELLQAQNDAKCKEALTPTGASSFAYVASNLAFKRAGKKISGIYERTRPGTFLPDDRFFADPIPSWDRRAVPLCPYSVGLSLPQRQADLFLHCLQPAGWISITWADSPPAETRAISSPGCRLTVSSALTSNGPDGS